MSAQQHIAVDLGASSGRVIGGIVGPDMLHVEELHRFGNGPVRLPDGLHWDVLGLYREVLAGLQAATRSAEIPASVAVDSWGIDYGLVDDQGALVGQPYSYRDARTAKAAAATHARIDPARLYAISGLQELPFTTIHQLAAEQGTGRLERACSLLLIPDLLGFWLTGEKVAEATNASTTGLFDATHATWSAEITRAIELDERLLPPLREPGQLLGPLRAEVAADTGIPTRLQVLLVGSHDTASAVVGVPADGDAWAYLACGTWSLVGVELERPLLSDLGRAANFTNERGVGGTIRYLRNVMGLWLLQESMRTWQQRGLTDTLHALVDRAGEPAPGGPVFDVDDAVFLPPGDMPTRIQDACRRGDQPVPTEPVAIVRCILDSLAAAYARAVDDLRRLTGREIRVLHLVGGGARNALLCQLTAGACGIPILAGPVEATAVGNLLVQASTAGALRGDLETLRALIRKTHEPLRYEPRPKRRAG